MAVNPATSFYKLNQDIDTLNKWSKQWIVTFNASKTQFFIKSGRPVYPPLYLNNTAINESAHDILLLNTSPRCLWTVTSLIAVLFRYNGGYTGRPDLMKNCVKFDTDKLEPVQRRACIIATAAIRLTKHETLLQEVGLETLKSRRRHHICHTMQVWKVVRCEFVFNLV
jgi:hypothetical protein